MHSMTDNELLAILLREPTSDPRLNEVLDRVGLPRDLTKIGGAVRAEPPGNFEPMRTSQRREPTCDTLVILFQSPAGARIEQSHLTLPAAVDATRLAGAIADHAVALRSLSLIGARPGAAIARELARGQLPSLRRLRLSWTVLGGSGVEAIAQASWLSRIEALELERCSLALDGVRALAQTMMPELQTLDLTDAGVDVDGLRALAGWQSLEHVVSLSLRRNALGRNGLSALLASPHLSQLVDLDLGQCGLEAPDVEQLASWARLSRLTRLLLDGNHLRVMEEVVWGETAPLYTLPADPIAERIQRLLGARVRF
jgi:hypothetical protein